MPVRQAFLVMHSETLLSDGMMQVIAVLDAMPSSNLKPDSDDVQLEESRVYRTTYMFSATMPPAVERLARKYLRRPVVVNIGSAGRATDNVTQVLLLLRALLQPPLLVRSTMSRSFLLPPCISLVPALQFWLLPPGVSYSRSVHCLTAPPTPPSVVCYSGRKHMALQSLTLLWL